MSSSGVVVNAECQQTFQRLGQGKTHDGEAKNLRYIIFKIQDNEVVVERALSHDDLGVAPSDYSDDSKSAFDRFVADLKELTSDFTDCRYAVFDFKFKIDRLGAGNAEMDKIVFMQLCPDSAQIKKKMIYAASAAAIKQALETAKFLQIQVSEESELAHKELLRKLQDKYGDAH